MVGLLENESSESQGEHALQILALNLGQIAILSTIRGSFWNNYS